MKHSLELTKVYKDFIESPAGIILDGFMNTIPGYNGAWIAMRNAIEQHKDMKIIRGLELLSLFQDEKFQKEFLESEQGVDGFGLCFEAVAKQRNEEKRKMIGNIFKGFIQLTEKEKEGFELERLIDILNKITIPELTYLKHLYYDLKPFQDTVFYNDMIESGYYHNNVRLEQPLTRFRKKLSKDFDEYYDNLDVIGLRCIQNGLVSLSLIFSLDFTRKDSIEDYDFSDTIKQYEFTEIGNSFISYILEDEKA